MPRIAFRASRRELVLDAPSGLWSWGDTRRKPVLAQVLFP